MSSLYTGNLSDRVSSGGVPGELVCGRDLDSKFDALIHKAPGLIINKQDVTISKRERDSASNCKYAAQTELKVT